MEMTVSVRQDEQYYIVGLTKGTSELALDGWMDKDRALGQAANIAIEFDLDLYVMGRKANAYEIRNTLQKGGE